MAETVKTKQQHTMFLSGQWLCGFSGTVDYLVAFHTCMLTEMKGKTFRIDDVIIPPQDRKKSEMPCIIFTEIPNG